MLLCCTHKTSLQRIALARMRCRSGQTILDAAAPSCKRELIHGMRLFGIIELTDIAPAYATDRSQIYYGIKYPYSSSFSQGVDVVYSYEEGGKGPPVVTEQGVPVIVKLTSSRKLMEQELSVRRDYQLSEDHVPKIYSIHHAEGTADDSQPDQTSPAFCISMECAENTLENVWLDMKADDEGERIPLEDIRKIAEGLLHLHGQGLVHGDFGSHNVGKVRTGQLKRHRYIYLYSFCAPDTYSHAHCN